MSVMLASPNAAVMAAPGVRGLWRSLPTTETVTGGSLAALAPGLSGWWDASAWANMLAPTGQPLGGWNDAVGSISDRSGCATPLAPFSHSASAGPPSATPRLGGLLGGVGRVAGGSGTLTPALDSDLGFQLPSLTFSPTSAWTRLLVWSRPNSRQNSGKDSSPSTLITSGSQPLLQMDSGPNEGALTVLSTSTPTTFSNVIERRHTHSALLRNVPGRGLDIWLDENKLGFSLSNAALPVVAQPAILLHDGTPSGSAQSWFHEAATWERALADSEITAVLAYLARWPLGPRRGIMLVFDGQSNAINYALNDGAATALASGIGWYLGALSWNIVATTGSATSYTMESGHGIYPAVGGTYPGSFLDDPNDGSDPSTWSLGTDGQAVATALASLASWDQADIGAFVWPWNETDSLRSYSEKPTFSAAARRFLALERRLVARSAGSLPLIWWNGIPYGSPGGIQMHREVVAEMAGDLTQNVIVGNPQTSDSNPRGSAWDPLSGGWTGGDVAHRDAPDNVRFAMLAAPIAARAILSSGFADVFKSIPSDLPAIGGPRIVHAYLQSDITVILTIEHDAGSDLKLPLQASLGQGFAVVNGGSPDNPGAIAFPSSCTRLDPTHLILSFEAPLGAAAAQYALYYPYGPNQIGRGNAVTDNYSDLSPPAGWDIAGDLGVSWKLDFPLAATSSPIILSPGPV